MSDPAARVLVVQTADPAASSATAAHPVTPPPLKSTVPAVAGPPGTETDAVIVTGAPDAAEPGEADRVVVVAAGTTVTVVVPVDGP